MSGPSSITSTSTLCRLRMLRAVHSGWPSSNVKLLWHIGPPSAEKTWVSFFQISLNKLGPGPAVAKHLGVSGPMSTVSSKPTTTSSHVTCLPKIGMEGQITNRARMLVFNIKQTNIPTVTSQPAVGMPERDALIVPKHPGSLSPSDLSLVGLYSSGSPCQTTQGGLRR